MRAPRKYSRIYAHAHKSAHLRAISINYIMQSKLTCTLAEQKHRSVKSSQSNQKKYTNGITITLNQKKGET